MMDKLRKPNAGLVSHNVADLPVTLTPPPPHSPSNHSPAISSKSNAATAHLPSSLSSHRHSALSRDMRTLNGVECLLRLLQSRKRSMNDDPLIAHKRARVLSPTTHQLQSHGAGRQEHTSLDPPRSPSPAAWVASPHSTKEATLWTPADEWPAQKVTVAQRLVDMANMIGQLPSQHTSDLLLRLLQRSPTSTLQFLSTILAPALKRDFLSTLPIELAFRVISFLDAQSLCRAQGVCTRWKDIIDQNDRAWHRLLDPSAPQGNSSAIPPHLTHAGHSFKDIYRCQHTLRQNWRKGRAKCIRFQGHPENVVTCLQFDDHIIVSGTDDSIINIHKTATGELWRQLSGHEGGVWALQFVGNTLVTGSTDRTVRVWDMSRGICTHVFVGHSSIVRCLQIVMPTMVDGRMEPSTPLIVTGSRDMTLRVWRLPDIENDPPFDGTGLNPHHLQTLHGHSHSVRALAAHGNVLISGSYDCHVGVWDLAQGRLVHHLRGHQQKVYSVVIDPERKRCMSGSMDSTIRVWDYRSGDCLQVLEGHSILVGMLGLSTQYLVSAAADTTLRVWSPDNGQCMHILAGHHGAITCFQHNDDIVISGSEGGLKMWDIKTGRLIRDLITRAHGVWKVAFDERRCVVAVRMPDLSTYFEVFDFGVHGLKDDEDLDSQEAQDAQDDHDDISNNATSSMASSPRMSLDITSTSSSTHAQDA